MSACTHVLALTFVDTHVHGHTCIPSHMCIPVYLSTYAYTCMPKHTGTPFVCLHTYITPMPAYTCPHNPGCPLQSPGATGPGPRRSLLPLKPEDWLIGWGGGSQCPPSPDCCPLHGSFMQELQSCDTDDDVAMCFIKNEAAFEKYLEFLVGRVQAESVMVSTAVQEFYKVPLSSPGTGPYLCPRTSPLTLPRPPLPA